MLLSVAGGSVNYFNLFGKQWGNGSSNLKFSLECFGTETALCNDTCTEIVIVAQITVSTSQSRKK